MRQRFSGGRPKLPDSQRTVLVSVSILPTQKAWASSHGDGNLSLGVRRAIAVAMQAVAPEVIAAEAARRAAAAADLARAAKEVEHLVYGDVLPGEIAE